MVYISHRGRALIDVWAKKAYGKSITEQNDRRKVMQTWLKVKDATIINAVVLCFAKAQMSAEEIVAGL